MPHIFNIYRLLINSTCSNKLQINTACSNEELTRFYNLFGPSARLAYINASQISTYDAGLRSTIQLMTFEMFESRLLEAITTNLSDEISPPIFLISPGDVRYASAISIPTRYIYEMLRDTLSGHRGEAVARLYAIFVRRTGTGGGAGYMLSDGYHSVLCKGGQWKLLSMTSNPPGSKPTHWKEAVAEPPANIQYLRLGYEGHSITIGGQLSKGTQYQPLKRKEYLPVSQFTLVNGWYYYPSSDEKLDSFIYDEGINTATIFRAMDAETCSVKDSGTLEWLMSLGVEVFRFVAVMPPDPPLDKLAAQCRTLEPSISEKYILTLPSLIPN